MAAIPCDGRDWASLPSDLLCSISNRLRLADYVRFSAVCASWRSAASSPSGGPLASRMPCLLVGGGEGGAFGEDADSCTLLDLVDGHKQRIASLPEIRGKRFIGSQHGWLFLLDEFSNVSLFNPLNRSQIDLPPITTLDLIDPIYDSDGSLISYMYHEDKIWKAMNFPIEYTLKQFRWISIRKVMLSANPSKVSDFTVVAIFNFAKFILFIRPGEKKWNWFDRTVTDFRDVIFSGGKLLTLNEEGVMAAIDLRSDPPLRTILTEQFQPDYTSFELRYLVADSVGDILQICRETYEIEEDGDRILGAGFFFVLKLDRKNNSWSPVKNLGEQSIFVGNSYSTALTSEEIPGLKKNCIYFTDDGWDYLHEESKTRPSDVGVCYLDDDHIEFFNPIDLQLKWPPPIWFTPAFRRN